MTCACMAWMAGIAVGSSVGDVGWWVGLGAVAASVWMWRTSAAGKSARWASLLTIAISGAAWFNVTETRIASHDIRRYTGSEPQLAKLTGRIVGPVHLSDPRKGAFGDFAFQSPSTLFELVVATLEVDGQPNSVTGHLLVKVDEIAPHIQQDDHVGMTGWLRGIEGPQNPGEADYRARLAAYGIHGRLAVASAGGVVRLPLSDSPIQQALRLRAKLADAAATSLRLGMPGGGVRQTMLELMLLGRRGVETRELSDAFRRVGLAHLLAISGAHMGILLGVVWLGARLVLPHPARAVTVVMIVLVFYVLIVPPQVPILRAAIMAGAFCLGYLSDRRWRATDLLACAAWIVLLWRPGDLFAPGFQLSFGVVASLILFVRPVGQRLWPDPLVETTDHLSNRAQRWAADLIAANIVAFLVTLPLVAYHFQLITPLAPLLSLLALPVVTLVLGMGFVKVVVGMVLPSAGRLLAGPLAWISDGLWGLVEHASNWPGIAVAVNRPLSIAWVIGAISVVVALLAGGFFRRRIAFVTSVTLILGWAIWLPAPTDALRPPVPLAGQVIRLDMLAVGNGSCFLIRIPRGLADEYTLMFDCGSQDYFDVGSQSVVPALRAMGVRRIDCLILSHADLDHFSGVLDVAAQITVTEAMMPPQMMETGAARPNSTTGALLAGLEQLGIPMRTASRGWTANINDVRMDMLWPPADYQPPRNQSNDTSLVLRVTGPGGRILLTGDIQQDAKTRLMAMEPGLSADITDLPHHGSFVPASPTWIATVNPRLVLQSSGPGRLVSDRWLPWLQSSGVPRLVTAQTGAASVWLTEDGTIHWQSFHGESGSTSRVSLGR